MSNKSRRAGRPKGARPTFTEGQPRDRGYRSDTTSRYAFGGATPYAPGRDGAPKLQFGDRGELTPRTIEQAGLTDEEKERAFEMLRVQAAYLDIYDCLDYPTDPEGHTVDLAGIHMTQPKVAIAWTLALMGFRQTGRPYIKKRYYGGPGVVTGAYTWVDARAADTAEEELKPEHRSGDYKLPPDTRRLAAQRDGDPGQELPPEWSVTPKITWEGFEDR